jgi:thiol-disulfide isomerase/thioredoxin
MKLIFCVLVFLCPCTGRAQTNTAIPPLTTGDTITSLPFPNILNSPVVTSNISGYKNKYILLDFWATWCSACMDKFNLLDSLLQQNPNNLQVILINTKNTYDTPLRISSFFTRYKNAAGKPWTVPTVYNDTIADQRFPHQQIPHYVWINPAGKIMAITGREAVTRQNLAAFISGQTLSLPLKADKPRPLLQ